LDGDEDLDFFFVAIERYQPFFARALRRERASSTLARVATTLPHAG